MHKHPSRHGDICKNEQDQIRLICTNMVVAELDSAVTEIPISTGAHDRKMELLYLFIAYSSIKMIFQAVRQYSSHSSTVKNLHAVASKGFNLQTDAYGK